MLFQLLFFSFIDSNKLQSHGFLCFAFFRRVIVIHSVYICRVLGVAGGIHHKGYDEQFWIFCSSAVSSMGLWLIVGDMCAQQHHWLTVYLLVDFCAVEDVAISDVANADHFTWYENVLMRTDAVQKSVNIIVMDFIRLSVHVIMKSAEKLLTHCRSISNWWMILCEHVTEWIYIFPLCHTQHMSVRPKKGIIHKHDNVA